MDVTINAKGYPTWEKDPEAIKDYSLDWTDWLGTDTIVTSTWTVPDGMSKSASGNTTQVTSVWLSGGVLGRSYTISNRITTAGGRTDSRSIEIKVRKL